MSLRPHQCRGDERLFGKRLKAVRGDARLDRDVGVDRERQRPWRDCCSQATTFGIGSPHAVLSQPQLAGALAISGGGPGVAPLALSCVTATVEWPFPKSLRRRSLSFIPRILALGERLLEGLVMSRIEFIGARLRTSSDGRRDRTPVRALNPNVYGPSRPKPGAKTLTAHPDRTPDPATNAQAQEVQGPSTAVAPFTRNNNKQI